MENNKSTGIVVAIIAIILVAVGVFWVLNMSNDEENTDTATSQTQQVEETQPQEESADIVAVAVETPILSTLVSAVQAAELVETLQSEGPFTVFAPTNDAFAALPEGTLDTILLPENQDQLASILTYHVVEGRVPLSSDLSDGQEVTTVQGDTLTISIRDGSVYIVDAQGGEALVQQADVEASNGVVHIIGSVLLPQ